MQRCQGQAVGLLGLVAVVGVVVEVSDVVEALKAVVFLKAAEAQDYDFDLLPDLL